MPPGKLGWWCLRAACKMSRASASPTCQTCPALPQLPLLLPCPPAACSLGFTVGRLFVPGEGPDLRLPSDRALVEPFGDVWAALQPEAGVFDEAVFQV